MNIYLLNYNNYGNRTIKGYATLADYLLEVGVGKYAYELEVNRSISDNLSTSITFNDTTKSISALSMPNYCLICDDNDNIVSRWFVLSCKHKGGVRSDSEGGQYTIELKRDVIYDFHQNIENSTVLCSRGYKDITSPLFLNKDTDQFPVNSIKYKEVMLKETDTQYDGAWLYFYRTVSDTISNTRIIGCTEGLADLKLSPEHIWSRIYNGITGFYLINKNMTAQLEKPNSDYPRPLSYNELCQVCNAFKKNVGGQDPYKSYLAIGNQIPKNKTINALFGDVGIQATTTDDPNTAKGASSTPTTTPDQIDWSMITSQGLREWLQDATLADINLSFSGQYVNSTYTKVYDMAGIESEDMARYNTPDSQFNIYCLPFPKENQSITINGQTFTRELSLNIVKALSLDSGCYDIQVLPYGPCKITNSRVNSDYAIPITLNFFGMQLENRASQQDANILATIENWIKTNMGGDVLAIKTCDTFSDTPYTIFLVKRLTRKFDISMPAEYYTKTGGGNEDYKTGANNYEKNKKGLNCYKFRLLSPDSQSIEELQPYFNYSGNGDLITGFHIYMKLQPYTPYLQVLPIYKGSGWNINKDFEDYRGLICGAGFSMAMANDKWAEYAANNKNYRAQFDRDIQTMQMNQAANVINRIGSGAATGAALGGAYGAALGTAAGAISAGIGLITDQYNIETAKKEFAWNIENMQAAPRTLRQIDAQNPNFRYYPYLEVYKCTEDEETRLMGYIQHHGSKIEAEGLFTDFIDTTHTYPYIECFVDIYAGNDITADVLHEINKELSYGVRYEV